MVTKGMKHILYLSYDGMTDPLGQSQVLPYLMGLSENGYRISLISFEKPELRQERGHIIRELLHPTNIRWIPLPYTKKPPLFSTVKDVRHLASVVRTLHRRDPVSLIHCRSYIAALVAEPFKRKHAVPWIFDMRGFWADERVEGGIWSLKNPVYRLAYRYFKRKEKQFFAHADQVISLTHNGKGVIHSWEQIPNQPIPIEVIPCCVDVDLFDPSRYPEKAEVRQELGLRQDELVMVYLGSIGTWYMLPEMLAFFKQLKQSRPGARFFFITGENPDAILAEAQRQGVDPQSLLIRKANREQVPRWLKACDFSIFFIKPVFSKRASSPTKQGEIMSMGIPIICNTAVGDTDFVIEKYRVGALISAFDEPAYQAVIDHLDELLALDAERIRAGAQAFYALEKGVEKYQQVYERLCE